MKLSPQVEVPAEMADALHALEQAVAAEAGLTEFGRFALDAIVGWQVDTFARAAGQRIEGSVVHGIVIGGLPRTGTSALHAMLAAATEGRSLTVPDALRPAADDPAEVAAYADLRVESLQAISPEFFGIHPISRGGIEECTPILEATLRCPQLAIMLHVPSYLAWLLGQDLGSVYEHWSSELARIDPAGSWVLKSPLHFVAYPQLLARLDGTVVELERDAVEWFTSFVNLVVYARRLFADPDPVAVAREWLERLPPLVAVAERVAAEHPDRFVRVRQRDLARRPIAVVDEVCERARLVRRTGWEAHVVGTARQSGPSVLPLALRDLDLTEQAVRRAFDGTTGLLT